MDTEDSDETKDSVTDSLVGTLPEGGQFYRRVGARLAELPDPSVHRLQKTPDPVHRGYHQFDKAHLVMLAEEGSIPSEIAARLLAGLREMEEEGVVDVRKRSGHHCHAGEAYLIDHFGEDVGGWIHAGRSTHDLIETGRRIVLRERLLDVLEACCDLVEAYARKAAEYADAVMPTYTGYQHAQVATFGYHLMAFERPIERDIQRLRACYRRINQSPAGAAVGTTSDFAIDRERVAQLLGFDGVQDNAEDVDKHSDIAIEWSTCLATLLTDLTASADQFLLWFSDEFALIDMPDRFCGTSSIMPQKRNPHAIEVVQREVDDVIGDVMSGFVGAKNIGARPKANLSTADRVLTALETWATLVSELTFDRAQGEALVYADWALATDLAGAIVRSADVSWRSAHQIVAILVRRATEAGNTINDVTSEDIDHAAEDYFGAAVGLPDDVVETVTDAETALNARAAITGSPAPQQVEKQIDSARANANETRSAVASHRRNLANAKDQLADAVDEIVGDVE